jgi:hypothetical protein
MCTVQDGIRDTIHDAGLGDKTVRLRVMGTRHSSTISRGSHPWTEESNHSKLVTSLRPGADKGITIDEVDC